MFLDPGIAQNHFRPHTLTGNEASGTLGLFLSEFLEAMIAVGFWPFFSTCDQRHASTGIAWQGEKTYYLSTSMSKECYLGSRFVSFHMAINKWH